MGRLSGWTVWELHELTAVDFAVDGRRPQALPDDP